MSDIKEQSAAQLEEYREYLESRKFHIMGTLALRIIDGGSEVLFCDPERHHWWWPYTSTFPNDYLWRPDLRFETPSEAYLYAELENWGRV